MEKIFRIKHPLLLLFFLSMVACVPQKQIVYIQSNDKVQGHSKDPHEAHEYKIDPKRNLLIQPLDVLYINISSADPTSYNLFGQEKLNYTSLTEASLSVLGFTVSDSGEVKLPIIGKLRISGMTLSEASDFIKTNVQNIIHNPIVSVRFVNSAITILGEVGKPGTYPFTGEQISIFKALGLSNDITEYGNRRAVVLVREENKTVHKYKLDLTKDDIFTSPFYYLRPNDILYVEPLKIRRFGMKEIPYNLFISLVTSVFLVMYYVKVP